MKKLALLCIAVLMCVSLSGCAFLRSMLPAMLNHVGIPKVTSTPSYVQSTAKPKTTYKPTPVPIATPTPISTATPTPTPTATPTAEPEESQPQGIQFPIAP